LEKLEYICLVGSLAFMGADRIDLLAGHGFFRLSPFLLFASLVVLIRFLVMGLRGSFQVAMSPPFRRQIPYLVVLALFLFLAFTSTILGEDPQRGLVALCGLVLVAFLGYCLSVRILADPAPEKLVVRSVTFALIVWLIFCIGGYIAWSLGATRLQEEASSSIASVFAPTATLYWIPRLSGFCLDANRAGFILVMYLALLDRFAAKTRYTRFLRFSIACFILLAVSRSAMLCWIAYYSFSSGFLKRLVTLRAAFRVAILAIVCLLVGLVYRQEIAGLAELWELSNIVSDRLSSDPGSTAGSHFQLIQRGFATWTTSTRTVVAGIGFAGSPRVLGDFFGDSKYGNFHDLYVSVLAELGLPAFLLFMILLGYPIIGRKGAAPFVAAIATFNVFLQSFLEPIFWVALALVWSFELKRRRARDSAPGSVATS
jgi:hypothetical protein